MKKMAVCVALLFLFSSVALAEGPTKVGGDVAFKSKYIWRGIPFNDEPVLWPDAWVNWGGLTLTAFGSMNLTDFNGDNKTGKFTEVDVSLNYTHTFKHLVLSLGYFHYSFPSQSDGALSDLAADPDAAATAYNDTYGNYNVLHGTGEFYTILGTTFPYVNVNVAFNADLINVRGVYLNPYVVATHTFFDLLTPTLKLGLGIADDDHNGGWFGVDKGGVTDFTGTFNLAFVMPGKLGSYMSIGAEVGYAAVLKGDLRDAVDAYGNANNFWFGFSINGYFGVGGEAEAAPAEEAPPAEATAPSAVNPAEEVAQ